MFYVKQLIIHSRLSDQRNKYEKEKKEKNVKVREEKNLKVM